MVVKIKEKVLQAIIEASKNAYPKEFFAYLSGNKIVEELVIVPSIYGYGFSAAYESFLPNLSGLSIIGTVHSHPNESNLPSKQDLEMFSKFGGKIHLIIAYPFNKNTIRAYNAYGKQIAFEVIK